MALRNLLLLYQIVGHLMGLILSFCIVVPMSLNHHEFNGNCLLFSQAALDETNENLFVIWSSRAYCNYVLIISVLMNFICSIQIYRLFTFRYRGTDSSFLSTFLECIMWIVLSLLVVPAAIIVSIGFVSWCEAILKSFVSCGDAGGLKINKDSEIDTSGFYIQINIVQFGTWAAFATCVGLAVLSFLKVFDYHQQETIQQVTLYRERQRLLTESEAPSSHSRLSTPPLLEI